MFGMGFGEIVLIGGIALVVIGPEKFPEFAKMVIKTVRDLRGYVDEMKSEVTKELNPLKGELNPLKKELNALSRIDPEKYIDSLTGEDSETESSEPKNPSVNEEDQKIMAVADAETYGEDPYG
ncbi:MAG: Sec-independent protein translocase protein TatB [Candidatus Hydrogenedentes bacterium]|nr:Sec-independent protein translocase protein TatB [Candidatus Hydrogenedentota bacterium]